MLFMSLNFMLISDSSPSRISLSGNLYGSIASSSQESSDSCMRLYSGSLNSLLILALAETNYLSNVDVVGLFNFVAELAGLGEREITFLLIFSSGASITNVLEGHESTFRNTDL